MKTISIEEFDSTYEPVMNPLHPPEDETELFATSGKDLDFVLNASKKHPKKVWTLVDSDNGLTVINGYHLVNRVHYIITKNDCEAKEVNVIYCDELSEA